MLLLYKLEESHDRRDGSRETNDGSRDAVG